MSCYSAVLLQVMTFLKGSHKVVLGESFTRPEDVEFHTFRYDFKPASIDHSQCGVVEHGAPTVSGPDGPGENEDSNTGADGVSVYLPNAPGSASTHTAFKGSRRPTQKECVLVVNRRTGQITLERVNSSVTLKKTRDGIKNPQLTVEKLGRAPRNLSHQQATAPQAPPPPPAASNARRAKKMDVTVEEMSSGSSSEDEDVEAAVAAVEAAVSPADSDLDDVNDSVLEADLRLSESGSDSD